MIVPPRGKPLTRPIRMEMAGNPARFAVTVKISDRYMATGSPSFSPALKAGLGVVGGTAGRRRDRTRCGSPARSGPVYQSVVLTAHATVAGLPAASIPGGRGRALPVGGKIIGQAFLEDEMLEAAYALERVVPAAEEA